ncbi:uncharacterized protein LOC105446391 [Strongylocentrotus purpuratus]|uniref:Death domain-containing protein n=1 Tax=Strongylocentrotus purpuratus TaxID=7668 RepID=A0A7M7N0P3_STRPU|nr:uncharacterized protein LOC105446391 [Strongylocentrotus purpuratus]
MQGPRQDSEPSQGRAMQVYHGSSTNEVSSSCVYDEESHTLTILKQVETLHIGKVENVHVGDIHNHVLELVQDQEEDCDGSTSYQEDMADSGEQISRPMTLRTDEGATQTNPTNQALTVVRTEFTDLECVDLADLICPDNDFQRLGHYLGFNAPALSRYRRENTGGGCHGVYKMLVDWKKRFLNHEQRENLANALENAGLKALASKVRHGQRLKSFSGPRLIFHLNLACPAHRTSVNPTIHRGHFVQTNQPPDQKLVLVKHDITTEHRTKSWK